MPGARTCATWHILLQRCLCPAAFALPPPAGSSDASRTCRDALAEMARTLDESDKELEKVRGLAHLPASAGMPRAY